MNAKQELFDRLQYLSAAVALPVMIDVGIAQNPHNGVANLLRKGLGIVAFNILEDFIKNKTLESLAHLSNSRISFAKLTESLQEAAISGALAALVFRAKVEKKDGGDWKSMVQDETLKIHSTKNAVFELSRFSLVSGSSNISLSEITEVLKAFGISGGWNQIKTVSDSIGGGLPDPSQSFKNAADRRHSAAHTASFRYDYQWLADIKNEILAIAASLDIILTARCRQVSSDLTKDIATHQISNALRYRFLEKEGTVYKETLGIGGRARKRWADLDAAKLALQPQLQPKGEFLIILNETKRIDDWCV